MKRVNYHMTDDQHARLKELSDRTGLTVAELVRRAIDEYLRKAARGDKKERER